MAKTKASKRPRPMSAAEKKAQLHASLQGIAQMLGIAPPPVPAKVTKKQALQLERHAQEIAESVAKAAHETIQTVCPHPMFVTPMHADVALMLLINAVMYDVKEGDGQLLMDSMTTLSKALAKQGIHMKITMAAREG